MLSGPAPRPLDRFETKVENARLWLGAGASVRRDILMRDLKRRIFAWLDHRTGVESAVKNFLYEDIPGSSGWHQVFGSVALFLFMVQAFTGILLPSTTPPRPETPITASSTSSRKSPAAA